MIKNKKTLLVIFPGWASFPKLYDKLNIKYDELLYFDEFEIEKFYYQLGKRQYDKLIILGWSMGTLLALKSLEKIVPDKLILLSPTMNFTETTPPLILKKMIKNLNRNKLLTIKEFCKINFKDKNSAEKYFEENVEKYSETDTEYLVKGLEFLISEKLNLLQFEDEINPLIILGSNDEVIINSNSEKVVNCFKKSDLKIINCGHNVIYEGKIEKLVRSYLSD